MRHIWVTCMNGWISNEHSDKNLMVFDLGGRTIAKKMYHCLFFLLYRLRSHLKNWCFGFHQGFQTPQNNKSTRPAASCFHLFLGVWNPWWNPRTRFWYIAQSFPFGYHFVTYSLDYKLILNLDHYSTALLSHCDKISRDALERTFLESAP